MEFENLDFGHMENKDLKTNMDIEYLKIENFAGWDFVIKNFVGWDFVGLRLFGFCNFNIILCIIILKLQNVLH